MFLFNLWKNVFEVRIDGEAVKLVGLGVAGARAIQVCVDVSSRSRRMRTSAPTCCAPHCIRLSVCADQYSIRSAVPCLQRPLLTSSLAAVAGGVEVVICPVPMTETCCGGQPEHSSNYGLLQDQ